MTCSAGIVCGVSATIAGAGANVVLQHSGAFPLAGIVGVWQHQPLAAGMRARPIELGQRLGWQVFAVARGCCRLSSLSSWPPSDSWCCPRVHDVPDKILIVFVFVSIQLKTYSFAEFVMDIMDTLKLPTNSPLRLMDSLWTSWTAQAHQPEKNALSPGLASDGGISRGGGLSRRVQVVPLPQSLRRDRSFSQPTSLIARVNARLSVPPNELLYSVLHGAARHAPRRLRRLTLVK